MSTEEAQVAVKSAIAHAAAERANDLIRDSGHELTTEQAAVVASLIEKAAAAFVEDLDAVIEGTARGAIELVVGKPAAALN
jgi:type II secretory pathway component PulK